jgi:hypothetical protein
MIIADNYANVRTVPLLVYHNAIQNFLYCYNLANFLPKVNSQSSRHNYLRLYI